MIDFHCGDAVRGCGFVARGERVPVVLLAALQHLWDHPRETLTLARIREVQRLVHDEGGEEHLRSLARARREEAGRGGTGADHPPMPGAGPVTAAV